MNWEFLAKMKVKILKRSNMTKYQKTLVIQVIENLEKTIKKGGDSKCIDVLKKKVVKLKQELILINK